MRSFIKSHRKATSLDESPSSASSMSSLHGDTITLPSQIDESLDFVPSTPSQLPHNSTVGTRLSPGFESFHRLANKKMFSSKLFKKSSTTNVNPQTAAPIPKEYGSAPGTPQSKKSESTTDSANSSDKATKYAAIKGTITHAWGDHSDTSQPVIILNNLPGSASDLSSDLGPAVRISSLRRGSAISTTSSGENTLASTFLAEDQSCGHGELQRDKHVYNELSKVKSKNRQARIHSHDDIINLGKNSSVSLELLASTASPSIQSLEMLNGGDSENKLKTLPEVQRLSVTKRGPQKHIESSVAASDASTIKHLSPSVSFEETPSSKTQGSENADTDDDEGSEYPTADDDDDDEDDSSKFSFELSGLNGRTSSVKYYSKPEPSDAVYIDDAYEDENFDEDMNFYEDSFDDMEFPSDDFHDGLDNDSRMNLTPNPANNSLNAAKPIKKYNDLFDLSDDADDDDYKDEATLMSTIYDDDKDADDNDNDNEYKGGDDDDDQCRQSTVDDHEKSSRQENVLTNTSVHSENQHDSIISNSLSLNIREPKVIYDDHPMQAPSSSIKCFSDIFDLDDEDTDEHKESSGCYEKSNHLDVDEHILSGTLAHNDNSSKSKDFLGCSSINRPKTPVHILVTSPIEPTTKTSSIITDPHLHPAFSGLALPPPARSQTLKFHDLNSNMDSEVPGLMSNLYFIDETEEDKYNERHKIADDDYIDEINSVPEDFNFSDSEQDMSSLKSPLRCSAKGSFRSTHSYSSQPTGSAKESTPTRNKLEIKNKTVTFFNYPWERSPAEAAQHRSPPTLENHLASPRECIDEYIISPIKKDGENYNPVTPTNSFCKPNPEYMDEYSLSPIQENSSSVDNSPVVLPSR